MKVNHSRRSTRCRLWHALTQTVQDVRARNAGADPDEIQRIVDEAVGEVSRATRQERRTLSRPRRSSAWKGRK
jgi:hypothetical protein